MKVIDIPTDQRVLGKLFYEAIKSHHQLLYHNILDVGCGYGIAADYTCGLGEQMTLIDISRSAIDFQLNRWRHCNQVSIACCTIHSINAFYDLIYYFLSFHHIIDITAELSKVRSLLTSDGELIICEVSSAHNIPFHQNETVPYDGFTPTRLSEILKENGFCITQVNKLAVLHKNYSDYDIYMIKCTVDDILQKQTVMNKKQFS